MSDDSLFLKGSRQATRSNDTGARDAEARDAEAKDAEAKGTASAHDDRDRPERPTETEPVEHPDLGFDLGNLDPAARPLTPQGPLAIGSTDLPDPTDALSKPLTPQGPLAIGSTDLPDPTDALSKGLATSRGDDRVAGLLGDLPDLRPGNAPRLPGGPRDAELYASGTISPPGSVGGNQQRVTPDRVHTSSDDRGNSVTVTEFSNHGVPGTTSWGVEPGMPSVSGTTTVTTRPDGSTSTVVVESMGDPHGSSAMVSARDDGTTRTETWFNPDGTVSRSNSTVVERSDRGTTTTTTWRDGDGAVAGSRTVTVDPLGSITTREVDRHGNESVKVTDADGKPLAQPSAQGDYPSSGSDTNSDTGTTDDDSDNDSDDGSDDNDDDTGTPVDDGNSGEAVARIDDESSAHSTTFDPSRADIITTTTGGTVVDERNTNTGNPKHQEDKPTDLPPDDGTDPADSPRGDDPAGNTGFSTAPDPSRADIITTTTGGTVVDERNTNTGNPAHRPEGPTLDPSTLPPDDGTGTGRPTGSGHYTGITPDQTGDGPNLDQGLGIDRGLTVNLDNGPDLSDLDLTGTFGNDQLLATCFPPELDADLGDVDDVSQFLDTNWDTPQRQSHIDTITWNVDLDGDGIFD